MKIINGRQANTLLHKLRTAAGLSRLDLARRLHVSQDTVNGRETNRRGLSVDALTATATEFGLEIHLLPHGTITTGHMTIGPDRDPGQLIRDLRRRAGLSLGDLAAVLGLTKAGLGNRETDARSMSVASLASSLDGLGYDLVAVPRPAVAERIAA